MIIYHYIKVNKMNSELLQFCTLNMDDFEDIFNVIVSANRNTSPMLINKVQTIETYEEETRGLITHYFKMQIKYNTLLGRNMEYIYGMRLDGKLIAVTLTMDIVEEYRHTKLVAADKTDPFQQFSALYSSLDLDDVLPGTATYHARISVLPDTMRKGIGMRLFYESCKYQLERGYEYCINGTFVRAALSMSLKLGGQILRQFEEVRPTFIYQIYIVKHDYKKLLQIYEELQK